MVASKARRSACLRSSECRRRQERPPMMVQPTRSRSTACRRRLGEIRREGHVRQLCVRSSPICMSVRTLRSRSQSGCATCNAAYTIPQKPPISPRSMASMIEDVPFVAAHQLHLGARTAFRPMEIEVRGARRAEHQLPVKQLLRAREPAGVPGEADGRARRWRLPIQVNFWPSNFVGRAANIGSSATLPAITPISEPSLGDTL